MCPYALIATDCPSLGPGLALAFCLASAAHHVINHQPSSHLLQWHLQEFSISLQILLYANSFLVRACFMLRAKPRKKRYGLGTEAGMLRRQSPEVLHSQGVHSNTRLIESPVFVATRLWCHADGTSSLQARNTSTQALPIS